MKSKLKRYEVSLPVQYNDGREVPDELLADAVNEIVTQFGGASFFKQGVEGYWIHGGVIYRDNVALIIVDLPDVKVNRAWMKAFKARWKDRLDQLEIWMVSHPINVE